MDLLVAGVEPRLICLAVAGLPHEQGFPVLTLPLPLRESRVFRALPADAVRRIDQDGGRPPCAGSGGGERTCTTPSPR